MQEDRWKEIEKIFNQTITLDSENRQQFIEQACGADENLRCELLSLVENYENPGDFLDEPVFSIGVELPEN